MTTLLTKKEDAPFPSGDPACERNFLDAQRAQSYLQRCLDDLEWRQLTGVWFGKRIPVPRLNAFVADEGIRYRYSGITHAGSGWRPEWLNDLRRRVEHRAEARFNSVLLNLYRDGSDHVSWHADAEANLGDRPCIASVSLGVSRTFQTRLRLSKQVVHDLRLGAGALLVMRPGFQQQFEHRIKQQSNCAGVRVSLTFRNIVG